MLRIVPAALVIGTTAAALSCASAFAGSPSPAAGAGGDPRSSGQGPGLVGDPVAAVALVVLIAVASLVLTLAYIRLTAGRSGTQAGR
jgi:hypothetical protein